MNNANVLLFAVIIVAALICIYFAWKIFHTKGYPGWFGIVTGILILVLSWLFLFGLIYIPIASAIVLVILHFTLPKRKLSRDVKEKNVDKKSEQEDMISPLSKRHDSAQRTQESNNIFISYRRTDSPDVSGRIYDRLTQQFGPDRVFKDVDSVPLGVDFQEHLDKMVTKCEVLLVVIGKKWLTIKSDDGRRRLDDPKDFVRIEIESALKRSIPIIPLLVQGSKMPSDDKLPSEIKKLSFRNGIFIRSDPDFHKDMDRLNSEIEKIVSN